MKNKVRLNVCGTDYYIASSDEQVAGSKFVLFNEINMNKNGVPIPSKGRYTVFNSSAQRSFSIIYYLERASFFQASDPPTNKAPINNSRK